MRVPCEGLGATIRTWQSESIAIGVVGGTWRLETAAADRGVSVHAARSIGRALTESERGIAVARLVVSVSMGCADAGVGDGGIDNTDLGGSDLACGIVAVSLAQCVLISGRAAAGSSGNIFQTI